MSLECAGFLPPEHIQSGFNPCDGGEFTGSGLHIHRCVNYKDAGQGDSRDDVENEAASLLDAIKPRRQPCPKLRPVRPARLLLCRSIRLRRGTQAVERAGGDHVEDHGALEAAAAVQRQMQKGAGGNLVGTAVAEERGDRALPGCGIRGE